jgi:hypothetical protein
MTKRKDCSQWQSLFVQNGEKAITIIIITNISVLGEEEKMCGCLHAHHYHF